MKIIDHYGTTLEIAPGEGPHSAKLIVAHEPDDLQEDDFAGELEFAMRPDSAAAIVGVLQAWIKERSKDGIF